MLARIAATQPFIYSRVLVAAILQQQPKWACNAVRKCAHSKHTSAFPAEIDAEMCGVGPPAGDSF